MTKKCSICESDKLIKYTKRNYDLVECESCGIIFNNHIPTAQELVNYYTEEYKIDTGGEYLQEKRRLFRLPEQIALVRKIAKYQQSPAKVIDIGCDKGYFIDEARRYGYITQGIEPNNISRAYCRAIGLDVVSSISEAHGNFDVAVMWHSLEHFPDPKAVLKEIKTKLNPDGYIFIRVPAFDSFSSKVFSNKWIWFQPENHYYHYSKKSLAILLEKAGFELMESTHSKPNNYLTDNAGRLSERIFAKNFDVHSSFRSKLSRIYEKISGVELFAVARVK